MDGNEKAMSILAYFWILFFLPLVVCPNSAFGRYHANQGLVLLLFSMACNMMWIIPVLGWIIAAVGGLFAFACLILGVINAAQGRMSPLPLIGGIVLIK